MAGDMPEKRHRHHTLRSILDITLPARMIRKLHNLMPIWQQSQLQWANHPVVGAMD